MKCRHKWFTCWKRDRVRLSMTPQRRQRPDLNWSTWWALAVDASIWPRWRWTRWRRRSERRRRSKRASMFDRSLLCSELKNPLDRLPFHSRPTSQPPCYCNYPVRDSRWTTNTATSRHLCFPIRMKMARRTTTFPFDFFFPCAWFLFYSALTNYIDAPNQTFEFEMWRIYFFIFCLNLISTDDVCYWREELKRF